MHIRRTTGGSDRRRSLPSIATPARFSALSAQTARQAGATARKKRDATGIGCSGAFSGTAHLDIGRGTRPIVRPDPHLRTSDREMVAGPSPKVISVDEPARG